MPENSGNSAGRNLQRWTSQSRLRAHVMGVNSYQYRPTRVVWNTGQRRWLPPVTVVRFSDGVGVSRSCRLHEKERKAFSILISWSRGITGCTVEFRKKRCVGYHLPTG
ncbi:uncharacterized protein LOC123322133 isoform X2 [Coccinella septempunctata]|uniref:uncharacterized protein LOC123322133 isoform X2 n=1 Tax=Coccinella septempunctata TaxID=41139 RepID=UPI001D071B47|nr:uncharacterized protein LOC123322133 isoform X2 [Coccinella septempunctata]